MQLTYRGEHLAAYDPQTGKGLLHKVVGPDDSDRWHRCTKVEYHREAGHTIATFEQIEHPGHALARQQAPVSVPDETVSE